VDYFFLPLILLKSVVLIWKTKYKKSYLILKARSSLKLLFTGSYTEYISAGPSLSSNGGWNSQLEISISFIGMQPIKGAF
jgi:hypothetical protein